MKYRTERSDGQYSVRQTSEQQIVEIYNNIVIELFELIQISN